MNNGWIPLRRGILDKLTDGTMSTNELSAFIVLLLLVDAETGSGTINAPVLHVFLPDISVDTCQRVLARLEAKKLIWRLVPKAHKRAYRYWIDKFECTRGTNKLRRTDLSQVFVSKNIKDIRYTKRAAHLSDDPNGDPHGQPYDDPHDSYNKDNDHNNKNDTIPTVSLKREKEADAEALSGSSNMKQGLKREKEATKKKHLSEAPKRSVSLKPALRWQGGEDCGWFDDGGRRLDFSAVNELIEHLGLEWKNNEVLEAGVVIPWKEAVAKIEGRLQ